ncbi:MAG: 6-phosphofructokinase [Phycisphaerales bacterium]|jgi:6-phosphofructokinase 1|nr:6-phosphofructokinase [Phycisphaerales bacterium]
MSTSIKRIGLFTGGGDCPGLNAVIRAVTKSAKHRYNLDVVGVEDGFLGLIQNRTHPLGWSDVSNILTLGGTILGTSNRANPQRYPVKKNGQEEYVDVTDRVVEHIAANHIDALVCIGGDGTMTGAANLIAHGINCVGVPKTIDNDLVGCEQTFGFDTAVTIAAECLDKIHSTAMSHHRVMVVEVMGRNAGWVALHAGLASGSDMILLPEIDYDLDKICDLLTYRSRTGRRFSIVCISEGAKPAGGELSVSRRDETSPDPIRLGGIANKLAADIETRTGLETRSTVLGHIQRGGTPTPFDRVLATRFGYHALELLMEGVFGKLVVWNKGGIDQVNIADVAGKQRKVPITDPLIAAARAVGTGFGDLAA